MTTLLAAKIAVSVLALALFAVTVALVIVKSLRAAGDRRRALLRSSVRPRVLAALLDDQLGINFRGYHGRVAEDTVVSMLDNVRGADRKRLADLLLDGGVIGRAMVGLSSPRATKRQSSAELLGAAGFVPGIPDLIEHLHDRDPEVRMASARAIGRIGSVDTVGSLIGSLDERRVPANTVSIAILRIGPMGAAGLMPALKSPVAHTRAVAAELIGTFGLHDAVDPLNSMLNDPDAGVRIGVVRALGRIGSPSSTRPLIALLSRPLGEPGTFGDEATAVAAIVALGQIGHRSCIPVLTACLDRTHRISYAAASALAGMGPRRSRRSEFERASAGDETSTLSDLLGGRGRTVGVEL